MPDDLWRFLPIGYAITVLIEAPILFIGLSARHSMGRKLFAGFWLTACTYPIVVLTLPLLFPTYWLYLLVAEIFAPLAECLLFWRVFGDSPSEHPRRDLVRDMAAITIANVASFLGGMVLLNWFASLY